MYRQMRVCAVIPAYNEEGAIAAAVQSVPEFVDFIVVVDDASRDKTARFAEEAGREIKLISHPTNRGVGAAIVSGYRAALAAKMDVAVVMAGDGQMDPADLPALLDPIADGGVDYTKGNRFAHKELLVQMPPIRVLGNFLLSMATKVTSGYGGLFDSQCGYTAVTAKALKAMALDEIFPRYGYPNDVLAHLHRVGARVRDVPVRPVYGPAWKSGVKWHTAIYPVGFVLLRSWYGRVRSEKNARKSAGQPDREMQSPEANCQGKGEEAKNVVSFHAGSKK